jgi:hypothetical protein
MKDQTANARRQFLKQVGLAAAGAGLGFSTQASENPVPNSEGIIFKPVEASPERIIRTVVGLRPYRPSGFVLRSEKINDKVGDPLLWSWWSLCDALMEHSKISD